ncbi:MAG: hypothetical protein ACNYPI_05510 [Arenicellales bacterium WSBS_2016_MAG_OTU3]
MIKMDHLVGSIEPGKFADFAVLDDDPTTIAPDKRKRYEFGERLLQCTKCTPGRIEQT